MSVDYSKLKLATSRSALKLLLEGSGSGTIPATGAPSVEHARITIPHGHTDDKLIFRVLITVPGFAPPYNEYFVIPWVASGVFATASIDTTNLYIEIAQSGFGLSSQGFNYYYRILVP